MRQRRILSIWFPRLAAERVLRLEPQLAEAPLAIVADVRGALLLTSLTPAAEAAGLRPGMGLGDARAICPRLVTRSADIPAGQAFLGALRRWAERFSPWVAAEGEAGLVLDVTGCAHLFGGEAELIGEVEGQARDLGLSVRLGLADTLGAAWAVARYAGSGAGAAYAGDAIDQEARATRSRARKRRWERGGAPPASVAGTGMRHRIVPPGGTIAHIGDLPVAALRLEAGEVAALRELGLVRIGDIAAVPRIQLARRVGQGVGRRFDQAVGRLPEPVSPPPPGPLLALRLTLPEPIGRTEDVLAGIDRLLPPLCQRLRAAGLGARRIRLTLVRTDGAREVREAALARPTNEAAAIRRLLSLKLDDIDAGFGVEMLRLEAVTVERVSPHQHRGQLAVSERAAERARGSDADLGFADLLGRVGARLGLDALVRLHPADSHIPEKAATEMAAAFSAPSADWPRRVGPRPLLLFPPEPITAVDAAQPPADFLWRRLRRRRTVAFGPERIAPEWWLDDPAWRSGPRDYWRVETEDGTRLWIFEAKGGALSPGWFAQGLFA